MNGQAFANMNIPPLVLAVFFAMLGFVAMQFAIAGDAISQD